MAVLAIAAWLVVHPQVAAALAAVLGAVLAIAVLSVALAAVAVAATVAIGRARPDRSPAGRVPNTPDSANGDIEE